jgi:hypothetical protein
LPLGCCFIVSQGVAIGLGYARLSACWSYRDYDGAKQKGWHQFYLDDRPFEIVIANQTTDN